MTNRNAQGIRAVLIGTLALLAGCSVVRQIEIRADVSGQVGGDVHHIREGRDYGGGKFARLEIESPLYERNGVRVFSSLTHESLLDTGVDRGEERVHLGLSWKPFR